VATPTPIPSWDVPNLSMARCLYLFGAGREKRIHCIPPFTRVAPLEFEDIRFKVEEFVGIKCSVTDQDKAFLDQIYADDFSRSYVVNDSNFLDKLRTGPRPPQRLFTNPE
jgi:alpha-D-ribose 1-methylphosphonate 5-phosphate C-P lyase